jgi:putative inorganic carbon (HCO3(-)) transporter
MRRVGDKTGLPALALVLGVAFWVLALLLWATGAVKGSFAVFLGTALSAAVGTGYLAAAAAKAKQLLRGARTVLLLVLIAVVPVVFDPHTGDVFNVPKYTVVVIGALALAGLWALASVHNRAVPTWRNGFQWVVAALVAWTAVSALTGMDVHVGLLGNYGSYDGLFSAACFGVVAMTAAEALDGDGVRRALGTFAFCGGAVVVVYGLIQLHDVEVSGAKWDFITWQRGSFAQDFFSTFGNPNHLGGYLAMLLPAVLVLGLGTKHWAWRVASGLLAVALLTELIKASARGAWLGAIAALVVLAVVLAPELRRRALLTASAAAGVVAIAAAGMALDGKRFLAEPLSALFQSGGNTSVEQRLEIWKAAFRIALDHPITGIGPDNFALIYPRYQSASWVAGLGPTYLVNGAHDIFMNFLADQGFVGLALFVVLLVFIGLRAAGTWRRLRGVEQDESNGPELRHRAQAHRACLAVVSASITAYVVQAIFNVQQVGLSFLFWVLVGMLAALSLTAGVPDSLRPLTVLSRTTVAGDPLTGTVAVKSGGLRAPRSPGGRERRAGGRSEVPWPTLLAAVAVTVAVVLLAVGADGPYRADHDYWAAATSLEQTTTSTGLASAPTSVGPTYFADMQHAMSLNPWEPTYPTAEATVLASAAEHAPTISDATSDLQRARSLLAKSVAESPLWGPYSASEARVDQELATLPSSSTQAELSEAISLLHKAIKDNPRDSVYRQLLAQAQAAERKAGNKA